MAWADVLGQDFAARILRTHLATGRVAQAYLLAGPDGVGKRRLALEMAKALVCEAGDGSRPCEACRTCRQIGRGAHPDVHRLTPGGASQQIKIEEARQLISRLALRPFSARAQVAIIEAADRLTEEAANALLKTLEEPSTQTRFVLTSAHPASCLPTIISRCQLIRCRPLPWDVIARILVEQQHCEPRLAQTIARLAGGSASAALGLAERWTQREAWLARLGSDRAADWLETPMPETREDVAHLLEVMVGWVRDLAVAATAEAPHLAHAAHTEALPRQARGFDVERCGDAAMELLALRESLEQFVSPKLVAALAREQWFILTAVPRPWSLVEH